MLQMVAELLALLGRLAGADAERQRHVAQVSFRILHGREGEHIGCGVLVTEAAVELAHRFVNGFDDPVDYFDWFMFPDKAEAYLATVSTEA